MRDFDSFKYACLFGGGAIRGAAHIGVLKAMEEIGITPTLYAGSSVGAIFAVLYALGYTCEELEKLFLDVNFELFRDISFGVTNKFAFSKGEVFIEWMRDLIESKFYGNDYNKGKNFPVKFSDVDKDIVVITTDMHDFSCCEFSNRKTPDFEIAKALRISCCMPGLMRAYVSGDKLLVDGDLLKSMPMWKLSDTLNNFKGRMIEIRLEGSFTGSDTNPVEYINGVYSCITSCGTKFVKSVYNDCDSYDCMEIDTGDVVVVDFTYPADKRKVIMQHGYDQAITYFKRDLLNKKKDLLDYYRDILSKLRNIEISLIRKKFEKCKSYVGDLYICLSEVKKYIDIDVYNDIDMYRKLLYSNMNFGLLGFSRCDNLGAMKSSIKRLIENLSLRINDLNSYIAKFE